jgi:D-amino peptidase
MKKLFISADIEGTCGIAAWEETDAEGRNYDYFCKRMTAEVDAAARGAEQVGYISTVKDAHDSARNIDPLGLPKTAALIRGWSKDCYCMMGGLDRDDYDAVAFTGYHSEAVNDGNPLSHTMTRSVQRVTLNGRPCPEFLINAYMAAYRGVPIVFLSGDEALCRYAKELIPGITTVVAKSGHGSAVISRHPEVVREEMFQGVKKALSREDLSDCYLPLPDHFELVVEYKDWNTAHSYSFYPGAVALDAKTVRFESDDYYEVMRFMHFCL